MRSRRCVALVERITLRRRCPRFVQHAMPALCSSREAHSLCHRPMPQTWSTLARMLGGSVSSSL
eukprot:5861318-Pleurochrysis_carterae.AAC.2